ncbi:MAG TPA: CoA-binding protein [Advenella kashmirensis]|uniref:CoA-binding protein n=1 Tax=Advenella kashmirensis TaxID=310575 RepID=A0A356LMD0_9BURK|nr:CoA-binding protein [Advenella kashmirensis]
MTMTHDDSNQRSECSSQRRAFNKALLNPGSVALIGASSNQKKNTARPLRFMQKHGFAGNIYPVNPSAPQINGVKAWGSIDLLPDNVDHAFVMIDSAGVTDVVEQCARKGIGMVTIYSDGFAEAGEEGMQRQQELRATARRLGVRVLGPNSIGLANVHSGGVISVNAAFEMDNLTAGDIGIISQSGSMMGSLMSRAAARGFGFSHLVSVGNESDISVGEILDAMVDDDATRVIQLFLETLRDVHTLSGALERARSAGKPVIAYKLGRSEQGDALSQSHTGAIAGNDAAMDAYFRAHSVIRVNMLETLFEIAPLAARYAHLRPQIWTDTPARVAVITTTGGGAATVVDNLGLRGFVAVAPPAQFISHMASRGLNIRQTPVIDLTLAASSEQYQDLLTEIMQSDWCDAVLCIAGSSAQFHPQYVVQPILNAVATAHGSSKPLVAFLSPEAQASLQLLQKNAIAAFRTPESCADALAAFFVPLGQRQPAQLPTVTLPDGCPASGNLSEPEAMSVFGTLGIDVVSSAMVQPHAPDHSIDYPVVLKVVSRDILHKTEAGGVKVGIDSEQALATALSTMADQVKTHCPLAVIDGYMVQKMEGRLIELMLGYRHDPLVGPTVMLGAGGITAELKPDFSLRLAPVSEQVAWQMIHEVKHTQLIRGYRQLPEGDCNALARAIVALSRLALIDAQPVTEAEINPLFVRKDGVVAVDAVVRLREISQL